MTSTGAIEVESGELRMSVNATSVFSGPVDLAAGTTLTLPGDDVPMMDPYEMNQSLGHAVDLIIDGGYCGYEPTRRSRPRNHVTP